MKMEAPAATKPRAQIAALAAVLLALGCTSDDACDTSNPLMPMCPQEVVFATPPEPHLVFQSNRDGNFEIYSMHSDGSSLMRLTNVPQADVQPRWTPDGSRIVFASDRDGNREIYIMNADGSGQQRLTDHPALDGFPHMSPDGRQIAFHSTRDPESSNSPQIFVMDADGGNVRQITRHLMLSVQPRWSPDGRRIAFTSERGGWGQIYVMNADGSDVRALTSDGVNQLPEWSPDGKRIAFASFRMMDMRGTDDTVWQIYVMNADGTGQMNVSREYGISWNPAWSRTGRIFFHSNHEGGPFQLYVMNADGSEKLGLTTGAQHQFPHAK
jgi:Tol biopolymer transport system component